MERFEGYSVKSTKAKRIARRVAVRQNIGVVHRVIRFPLFLSSAGWFAIAISLLLLGRVDLTALFPSFLIFLALWILYAVFLSVFRRWACTPPQKMEELATQYVRILLTKTLALYRKEILAIPKYGNEFYRYAYEYAARYILTPEEKDALLERGKLSYEGEELRRGYERFLREIVLSDDRDVLRYIEMCQKLERLIEKWCQRHLPRYNEIHFSLIEENISLLRQYVTEQRQEFLDTNGLKAYMHLLEKLTVYRHPDEEGRTLLIPTKERHEAFCKVVEKLDKRDYKPNPRIEDGSPNFSHIHDLLLEYGYCIKAYEEYVKQFVVAGNGRLDDADRRREWYEKLSLQYESTCEKYEMIFAADQVCWFCGYPKQMRVRCTICNYYICEKCGRCQCDHMIDWF